MMKIIFTLVALAAFPFMPVRAQEPSDTVELGELKEQFEALQSLQKRQTEEIRQLTEKYKAVEHNLSLVESVRDRQIKRIDSLASVCDTLTQKQSEDSKSVNGRIDNVNSDVRSNNQALRSHTLWGGVLAVVMLAAVGVASFLLSRRIKSGSSSIDEVRKAQEALKRTQALMQEESVKLDDKMLAILDKRLSSSAQSQGDGKPDHSLALKVADEIVRIELNMSHMDPSVKGFKQLSKAVERIKNNFQANGYEIVDMLGKPYDDGMKVTANFVADDSLEAGAQIITGVTKPQINFNGQMIQAAQITVSQNI